MAASAAGAGEMAHKRLAQTLRDLGLGEVQASSIEWAFDYKSTASLLTFIADNLRKSNSLTVEELKGYKDLQESGKVLHGAALKDALKATSAVESDSGSESLRFEIELLESQVKELKSRTDKSIGQKEKLGSHLASLSNSNREPTRHAVERIKKGHVTTSAVAVEWNDVVNDLTKEINSSLDEHHTSNTSNNPPFMSFVDVHPYTTQDDCYTREVKNYILKQFQQGLGAAITEDDSSRYALLEINNPEINLVKGESKNTYLKYCEELNRLRDVYEDSIKSLLQAQIRLARGQSSYDTVQNQVLSNSSYYETDIGSLQKKITELESRVSRIRSAMTSTLSNIIPQLARTVGDLESTFILQGDYDLKIARQNYHLSKQERVIELLLSQRARHTFLELCYAVEMSCHRYTKGLYAALGHDLELLKERYSSRMERVLSILRTARTADRQTIDSRDLMLTSINDILSNNMHKDENERSSAFTPVSGISHFASNLAQRAKDVDGQLQRFQADRSAEIKKMLSTVGDLRELLFGGSATAAPRMRSENLELSQMQLKELTAKIATLIDEIMREHATKSSTISTHAEEYGVARDIFVQFLLEPEVLESRVAALEQRVERAA